MDLRDTLIEMLDKLLNWAATSGLRLLFAIAILIIAFKVIKFFAKKIERVADCGKVDKTLAKLLAYIFSIGMKCLVAVALIGYVGIDTSGFAALITSFGVCAGLLLNGTLANLAGGVMIVITRPFKVDDYIEAEGHRGTVEDIHLTFTRIRTDDNLTVFLANGRLSNGNVVNYSLNDIRRIDMTFSVGYSTDFEKAKEIISETCRSNKLVLAYPEPVIRVSGYAENSLSITAKIWVKNADYDGVRCDLIEAVKLEFDKAGIENPKSLVDVQINKN